MIQGLSAFGIRTRPSSTAQATGMAGNIDIGMLFP
jgi:hypothetical protein